MIFESLWPLLFLAAVPVIIILYLLKPKGKDRLISSNLLWQKLLKNEQSRTFFEKFVHNILMYLQILITALLVTALMAPFFLVEGQGGGRKILLLDTSGSMQHVGNSGKTRLEEAVEEACDYVRSAGDTRFCLVTVDAAGADLLAVDIADADSLVRLLKSIECSDGGGALTTAQGLIDTLAGGEGGELSDLIVYTDGGGARDFKALHSAGEKSLVVVGEAVSNVANEYTVYAQLEDGFWDVMVGVANYSAETVSFDVSLYDEDERLLGIKQMRLAPSESSICLFQEVDWKGNVMRSQLGGIAYLDDLREESNANGDSSRSGGRDSLAADNVSWAVKEREDLICGLLVGKGNIYIEKAYQAVTGESILRGEDDRTALSDSYNVVIYDVGQTPGESANNRIRFGDAFGESEETLHNVVLTVKACDLTAGLADFTVGVNTAYCFALPEGAESFIEYGGKCVGYYRELDGGKEVVVGFDIRESEFPLMAEFPIFLTGAMNYLSDTSWLVSHICYAGEGVALQPWAEVDRSQFDNCPEKAGVYQIENEDYQESYVVRFQTATESDGREEAVSAIAEGETLRQNVKQSLRNLFLLLVLILLAAEWIVYVRQLRYRGWFYTAVRGVVFLCVLLALFDVHLRVKSTQTATVFMVDLSESNIRNQEAMSDYLNRTIAVMPEGNSYGIVTFGKDTLVEQFLTPEKQFGGLMTIPERTATNFEQAVSGALTMIPPDSGGRLVLLTDGRQTGGNIQNMARALTAGGTEFLAVLYESERTHDAYIENVELPAYLHPGDEYFVTVLVESNYDTDAELVLYNGSSRTLSAPVHLNVGSNRFVFRQQAGADSLMENLRVQIQAPGDTCAENDSYSAYSVLEALPKTLVISGMGEDVFSFTSLLGAAGCDVSVVSALNAPDNINAMLDYKCIILADAYIDDLPAGFLANLETYVKDYGCGFVCCGGEDSFALGGYRDTVLETVLPVDMELRGVDEIPTMAMVMVIDHSGSMLGGPNGSGTSNLDIAIRAATVAVDNLRDTDYVGVLTFDDKYSWQVELTGVTDRSSIKDSIKNIKEGGGTTIKPALQEAYRVISASDASIKHVVLLTDGMGETTEFQDVANAYSAAGITLSTVAVGDGSDTRLLERLADSCGGRYYYSDISTDIPKIFAQEVFLSGDSYIQNGDFSLAVNAAHELTTGLFAEGWPHVYGYVSSTPKTASRTVIASAEKDDPILTVWQYGLGRTAAWNSDVTGEWTGGFSGQEDYVRLWKRIVDYAAGNAGMGEDKVNVAAAGESVKVSYRTDDYDGGTEIFATVIKPDGGTEDVKLHAVAPGSYEAELSAERAGLYHFNIRRTDGGEISSYMTTAAAVQFSDEYKFDVSTDALLSFAKDYGRIIDPEENIWRPIAAGVGEKRSLANLLLGLAILLFLADVTMRRFQYVPKWAEAGHSAFWGSLKNRVQGRGGAEERRAGQQREEEGRTGKQRGEERRTGKQREEEGGAGKQRAEERAAEEKKTGERESGQQAKPGEGQKSGTQGPTKDKKRQKNASDKKKKKTEQTLDTSQLLKKKDDRNR